MKILKIVVGSFAFMGTVALAAAADAPVANLFAASGKILVDQGHGFIAAAGQNLNDGDRIFVGDKSSANVAYATCTVKLDKPAVFVVSKAAPCAQGANQMEIGSVIISPAVDDTPGGGGIGTLGTIALTGVPIVVAGGLLLLTASKP
jgi:hypothetical protein